MSRLNLPPLAVFAALLFSLGILCSGPLLAQEEMNDVVRLKSGKEYVGYAIVDTTRNTVKIRTREGDLVKIPLSDVESVTMYNIVREAPGRGIPPRYGYVEEDIPWTCGRTHSWYFLELRAFIMRAEANNLGLEVALGRRFGGFSVGVGASVMPVYGKLRVPVFLHAKYTFSETCVNPYLFLDAGFPFDSYTSTYSVTPSTKYMTNVGPKMAGLGAGLDFALTKFMDISVDAGYRFYSLAGERLAQSCNGEVKTVGYDELHSVFLRVGVTF